MSIKIKKQCHFYAHFVIFQNIRINHIEQTTPPNFYYLKLIFTKSNDCCKNPLSICLGNASL